MSTIKCKFCGRESESQYHEYCGFFNVYNFGGPEEDRAAIETHRKSAEYKASQMYHDETLKAIKNISLEAGSFKYNESKQSMERVGTQELFGSGFDGVACNKSFLRSSNWIAHFEGSTTITINYEFAGKRKTVKATISPKQSEGIWYPCLHIDDKFNLEVGIYVVPANGETKQTKGSYEKLATVPLDVNE